MRFDTINYFEITEIVPTLESLRNPSNAEEIVASLSGSLVYYRNSILTESKVKLLNKIYKDCLLCLDRMIAKWESALQIKLIFFYIDNEFFPRLKEILKEKGICKDLTAHYSFKKSYVFKYQDDLLLTSIFSGCEPFYM